MTLHKLSKVDRQQIILQLRTSTHEGNRENIGEYPTNAHLHKLLVLFVEGLLALLELGVLQTQLLVHLLEVFVALHELVREQALLNERRSAHDSAVDVNAAKKSSYKANIEIDRPFGCSFSVFISPCVSNMGRSTSTVRFVS